MNEGLIFSINPIIKKKQKANENQIRLILVIFLCTKKSLRCQIPQIILLLFFGKPEVILDYHNNQIKMMHTH